LPALSDEGVDPSPLKNPPPPELDPNNPPEAGVAAEDPPKMDEVVVGLVLLPLKMELDPVEGWLKTGFDPPKMESPLLPELPDAVVHAAAAAAKIDPEPKRGVEVAPVDVAVGVPKDELTVAAGVTAGLPKAELAVAEGVAAGLPKIEPTAAGFPKIELEVEVPPVPPKMDPLAAGEAVEAPNIDGEENAGPPPKVEDPAP
jgi:hypothetical protein